MKNVILFAGALYDSRIWTNRQHVASRLARRGWRVLYVEPRVFLPRTLLKYPGTGSRWRWFLRTNVPVQMSPNVWVIAQMNIIPWSRESKWISAWNHFLNRWVIRLHARRLGMARAPILLYDTEAVQYFPEFPDSRVVYDCVDDHRAQAGVSRNPLRVEQEEAEIAKRASAISVTTQPLKERFSALHHHVQMVPNAAAVHEFFTPPKKEPEDIARIPGPRIGIVGTLDGYKIDVPLLVTMAKQNPKWQIVLIGPVTSVPEQTAVVPVSDLQKYPNVHFLGAKLHEDIPGYVHALDVAIIPYRETSYNRASFPLKFWEFMASGVPVISSGLPSLEAFSHLAPVAHSAEEYGAFINQALSNPEHGKNERQEEARAHDWSNRVDGIENLLLESLGS